MPRSVVIAALVVAALTALTGIIAGSELPLLIETVLFYTLIAILVAAGVRALWLRRAGTRSNTPRA